MPLLLTAGMLILTAAAVPDYSAPENTVRTYFECIKKRDIKNAYLCFCEALRKTYPFAKFQETYYLSQHPALKQLKEKHTLEITEVKKQGDVAVIKTKQTVPDKSLTEPVREELFIRHGQKQDRETYEKIAQEFSDHFNGKIPFSVQEINYTLIKEHDGWKFLGSLSHLPKTSEKDWLILTQDKTQDSIKIALTEFIRLCQTKEYEKAYKYLAAEQKQTLSPDGFRSAAESLYAKTVSGTHPLPFILLEIKYDGPHAEAKTEHLTEADNDTDIKPVTYHLVKENGKWKLFVPKEN